MTLGGLIKEPETFEERRECAFKTLSDLAKWPHCNHEEAGNVYQFDEVVEKRNRWGHIPDGVMRNDRFGPVNDYTWQIFVQTLPKTVGMSRSEVEKLYQEEQEWENTETATDGSKGQARAAHNARLLCYRWLLEGDNDA